MNQNINQKIILAVENNCLKLEWGKKSWYSYTLDIHELIWARNMRDGYDIHVYDSNENHLTTVKI